LGDDTRWKLGGGSVTGRVVQGSTASDRNIGGALGMAARETSSATWNLRRSSPDTELGSLRSSGAN
jgi:hypothetical protein